MDLSTDELRPHSLAEGGQGFAGGALELDIGQLGHQTCDGYEGILLAESRLRL